MRVQFDISRRSIGRIAAVGALCVTTIALANPFGGVPNTMVSGTPASAAKVNENFDALTSYVNALDQRLDALESQPVTASAPIGTVIASMLTPAQLALEVAAGEVWVLADGSSHPSSAYAAVTGNANVPDLRGVFLRGQNAGRTGAEGNPDAGALGAYQADAFRAHDHSISTGTTPDDGCGFGGLNYNAGIFSNGGTCSGPATNMTGGDETRPKNVTVNYFIRVD